MNSEPTVTPDAEAQPGTPRPPFGVNLFFRIAAGLVLLFVVTIFALIAILFGDPAAPISQWLDQHGMQLIIGELCAILIIGALAMTIDRWQAIRAASAAGETFHGK